MSIEITNNFIRTYVWSVVLRGCETWVINETAKRSLETGDI